MKRILILISVLVFSMALSAEMSYQANLGFDMGGNLKFDVANSQDLAVKMGITPSVEVLMPAMPNLMAGLGVGYQLGRGIDETYWDKERFGFIPIYLTGKYAVMKDMPVQLEGILNLGFDIMTGNDEFKGDSDLKGGLNWGIGVGANHPQGYNIQLMYMNYTGGEKGSSMGYSWDYSATYSTISIMLGYRFK